MNIKECIECIMEQDVSKYRIAKVMDMQPIMVDRFLKGQQTTIRRDAAKALLEEFGFEIDDDYINGCQKRMFINKDNNLDHN